MAKHRHPAKQPISTQVQTFTIQGQMFSGPLPPPEQLARYNEIIPNGADRIMTMAEEQAKHRQKQEDRVVSGNLRSQVMGTICAFLFGMSGMGLGGYLIMADKGASGLTALIGSMAALVIAFIRGRSGQERERQVKRDNAS